MKFDIEKIKREVEQIQKEKRNEEKKGRGLSTLLQFYQGRNVKVILQDGETIRGKLTKYSLYEIEVENSNGTFIIWKQNIKYINLENE